ncbi:MAG TPA: AarF/UbiB family protein, partial [Ilumatobacter sp.]
MTPTLVGSVRSFRRQLGRASEIATVLSASGFSWLVGALGLTACVSLRCRVICSLRLQQCPHHVAMDRPLPERMRVVLERLGPTFVKAGQMLALRPDYVPLPYADALRLLHSHAQPFPAARARALVEHELGAPIDQLFAAFEPEPFAAASLAQVHRARLTDSRVVAVKIQRPGVREQIDSDLALLRFLAARLQRRARAALAFRPTDAVEELAEYTRREL